MIKCKTEVVKTLLLCVTVAMTDCCYACLAEADGCLEMIADTAEAQQEWISKMQARGMCTCDEEHMFNCGASDPDYTAPVAYDGGDEYRMADGADYGQQQDELDQVGGDIHNSSSVITLFCYVSATT